MTDIVGIHHVAAVTTDFKRTTDFYSTVLGLKRSKSVELEGVENQIEFVLGGSGPPPFPILTFAHIAANELGAPTQIGGVVLAVRQGSLAAWRQRLLDHQAPVIGRAWAFGEELLCFTDPDGLELALTEMASCACQSGLSFAYEDGLDAIMGVHSVEIQVTAPEIALERLLKTLGLIRTSERGQVTRFQIAAGHNQSSLDLVRRPRISIAPHRGDRLRRVALRLASEALVEPLKEKLAAQGFDAFCAEGAPWRLQVVSQRDWDVDIVLSVPSPQD